VILVDTSVWIELLNGKLGARILEEQLLNFATCSPVAQEVLQGLRRTPRSEAFRESFLSLPFLSDPLPLVRVCVRNLSVGQKQGPHYSIVDRLLDCSYCHQERRFCVA
jgi:predicted nucleic acid-binding protein